jgi:hypothetical protein
MVEVQDVEVMEEKENWNYYRVCDGTVIKVKIVLLRLLAKENGRMLPQDYSLNAFPVTCTITPPDVVTSNLGEAIDLSFDVQKETWNEYKLANGCTFFLKPTIIQIDRTKDKDPAGSPIYKIQSQPVPKIRCNATMSDKDAEKWL